MGILGPRSELREPSVAWTRVLFAGFSAASLSGVAACSQDAPASIPTPAHDAGLDAPRDLGDLTSPALDAGRAPPPIACPPVRPTTFVPSPHATPVVHRAACTTAGIAAFVEACVVVRDGAAPCNDWYYANVAGAVDGGVGTPCGNCIDAPMNGGVEWLDPLGFGVLNFGACIEVLDGTGGAACASAYDNARACRDLACNYCSATESDYAACTSAALASVCSSYAATMAAACGSALRDGGVAGACTPTGPNAAPSVADFSRVATIVCGGAVADASAD